MIRFLFFFFFYAYGYTCAHSLRKNQKTKREYRGSDTVTGGWKRTVDEDDRVTDRKQRDDVHNVDGCRGGKDRCEALVLAVTTFGQS